VGGSGLGALYKFTPMLFSPPAPQNSLLPASLFIAYAPLSTRLGFGILLTLQTGVC